MAEPAGLSFMEEPGYSPGSCVVQLIALILVTFHMSDDVESERDTCTGPESGDSLPETAEAVPRAFSWNPPIVFVRFVTGALD